MLADLDLGDLIVSEEALEFAVGHDLRFPVHRPELLEQKDCDQREEHITDVEMPRSLRCRLFHDRRLIPGNVLRFDVPPVKTYIAISFRESS